jgi:uncharacterized damage-inducible protein DinB
MTELERFIEQWNRLAGGTAAVMRTLPESQYDFRPDPGGRSIGEAAWHLAEIDGYLSYAIQRGRFDGEKPPNIARPRNVGELAPAYEVVHREAVDRIALLGPSELDRTMTYLDGSVLSVRQILWERLLLHAAHHRGQLVLLNRLAGGIPPGVAGRNREETAAQKRAAEPATV